MKPKHQLVLVFLFSHELKEQTPHEKSNILFISVNDLKNYIEDLLSNTQVETPNMKGTVFSNPFCCNYLYYFSTTTLSPVQLNFNLFTNPAADIINLYYSF